MMTTKLDHEMWLKTLEKANMWTLSFERQQKMSESDYKKARCEGVMSTYFISFLDAFCEY